MQSQINYDNFEQNRDLLQLSMRFAKLSDRKREILKILAEKDYITNKEIASVIGCSHSITSSLLAMLRNEQWIDSETHGRNAYWFFVDDSVKPFVLWERAQIKIIQ